MFTVTGTATSTSSGYNIGQPYTFVFTLGPSFQDNGTTYYYSNRNLWSEETTGDNQLWATITGTGVTGAFIRPTALSTDPYSMLRTWDGGAADELMMRVDADTTTDIGLKTPGGQAVSHVVANMTGVTNFAFTSTYTQPTTYFSAYLGNYVPASTVEMAVGLSTGATVGFTATGVTIAAVPEPSAYSIVAGMIVLALTLGRRCRLGAGQFGPTSKSG